jgi:hypothetical protein
MGAVATAKPLWVNYLYCHWLYLLVYRRKFRSQTSRQYGQMKSRAGQRQREEKLCFSNDLWLRRVEE